MVKNKPCRGFFDCGGVAFLIGGYNALYSLHNLLSVIRSIKSIAVSAFGSVTKCALANASYLAPLC